MDLQVDDLNIDEVLRRKRSLNPNENVLHQTSPEISDLEQLLYPSSFKISKNKNNKHQRISNLGDFLYANEFQTSSTEDAENGNEDSIGENLQESVSIFIIKITVSFLVIIF